MSSTTALTSAEPRIQSVAIDFSCTGAPNCVGTYQMRFSLAGCPSPIIHNGVLNLGINANAPAGPVTLAFNFVGGNVQTNFAPTCSVTPFADLNNGAAGTWDGASGTFNFLQVAASSYLYSGRFSVARPAFAMTVTSNLTPTTSSATAQFQARPQDVGTAASVYVFAHVPANLIDSSSSASLSASEPPKRTEKADSPAPCVLAQLLQNGQLIGVTASTLAAYVTTVLTSESQAVTLLNNVPTPNIAGATFYLGYGATATVMFTNGTYQGAVTISGAVRCNATLLAAAAPNAPGPLTGLWWNRDESGWGVHFTRRRNIVFAAMYTYDPAGIPKWYVASGCAMSSASTATSGTCNGTLYEVSGSGFFNTTFNTTAVRAEAAGTLQVAFQSADHASMSYTLNGQPRTVALTRQMFATGSGALAVDYTDLWWNPNESGWGLALTQQYGVMFLAWYVYDGSGRPVWYVASNCVVSGSSCSGDLYRTTGPPFGPSFDPNRVEIFSAGAVSLSFIDANNAALTYTVNGVREVKFITRQVF